MNKPEYCKSLTALRTPGGKSKVVKRTLAPLFPEEFENFYEPFLGGASVALFAAQMYPEKEIYVNDLNENLYVFHKMVKERPNDLVELLHKTRSSYDPNILEDGKKLLKEMQKSLYESGDDLVIAASFYTLNKISFSGLTEHGSISADAYRKTFNDKNIDKILEVSSRMINFEISSSDFADFMKKPSENDFTFLDPPYQINSSNLYGKNGDLHKGFDHQKFLDSVKSLKGKWMITYNDNEWLRESYKDYKIINSEYRYTMSFQTIEDGSKKTRMKNELIILNY